MNENQRQKLPTRIQALIFHTKASLLQARRGAVNLRDKTLRRYAFNHELENKAVVAESKTALWTEKALEEQFLLAGKVQNLRVAIKKLNGLEIPANAVFSFWKHVGKTTRSRGFVAGRELREGCIIPNVGGGLCQLSNALYDAALKADFEIIERHAHTQIVSGSLAEQGRDATVFWNYVDLRFKSPNAFRIEAVLDAENLIVRFRGEKKKEKQLFQLIKNATLKLQSSDDPGNCATCGVNDCFRVIKPKANLDFGRTAFLLDEFSSEFDKYVQEKKSSKDHLFIPLDGRRFKKANYAWTTEGFAQVKQSLWVTALRSYKSRKLAAQGASRQLNLLAMYEHLAKSYAKNLPYDALHVVVQQNLLPFLWREGVLGGRTFDVLMTALPMKALQERLDLAKTLHPESKTLADFRADAAIVEAETEALKQARKIITTHTEIASLFSEKSEILDWVMPAAKVPVKTKNEQPRIVFPASTLGRKGAYELREALHGLDVKLITFGAEIEGQSFWDGLNVERGNFADNWLDNVDLVVLPAFVEHKPRRLLQAAAAQIPVIASKACGLENVDGIETVEVGDVLDLREKILSVLSAGQDYQKKITHVAKSFEMLSK